jgi:integrase/recombinase XerD
MPKEITPETFEKFVQERRYLYNVSPNTEQLYRNAWGKWQKYGPDPVGFVSGLRQAGTTATGCNIHIRSLNAFFRWAGQPPMRKLKEEDTIPPTFTPSDVQRLLKHKPRPNARRMYLLVLTLLDAGLRINEALSLRKSDVDLDNLLFLVRGKGSKERMVPFSLELRKHLWRHLSDHPHSLVFSTGDGKKLMHRNVLRDVKALCLNAGVKPPRRLLHSFRHTFAITYLRNGGSVFHLQRALGHSTLDMSRRYANLTTDDLVQMQQRVSVLQAGR